MPKQHHASYEKATRRARLYLVARQATDEERHILRKAADREFKVLERLNHPGVVRADIPTECDFGPVLLLRTDPDSQRLDHFLQAHGPALSVDARLEILRQLADVVRYAHAQRVVHRSLSPQCILLKREPDGRCAVQVFNWQTGIRLPSGPTTGASRVSATLHAGQLLEDASLVFLAPEALAGGADGGAELDLFSLGALAYLLFTGRPPAASQAGLQEKLRLSGGLNIAEALDGAVTALQDLVRFTANADVSLRYDIDEFLDELGDVEDELTRPSGEWVNPLNAKQGDRLEGGFTVLKRLGGGSASIVHLVERGSAEFVLKLARKPEDNARIKSEFEILKRLRWPQIAAAYEWFPFGDLLGFTMDSAGDATLAHQLRQEGPLDLTLLQQFGEDLLRTIEYLDKEGIPHRDIKPENMGVRVAKDKKRKELCLFDFSLSSTPPENIAVGTFPYLDSFLATRKVKRWDVKSECFSAAMTLHEMATGVLPKWGDVQSARDLIPVEVTIQAELFPAELRDRFRTFFQKALRRDYTERFDNPAEMIEAWREIFATIDRANPEAKAETPFVLADATAVSEGTQLIILDLSTRLSNALDRLDVHTVGQLLRFPLRRIYGLPGVGHKTRRELGDLFKALRSRLPQVEALPPRSEPLGDQEPGADSLPPTSVEAIAHHAATLGRTGSRNAVQDVVQRYLGWRRDERQSPTFWPSQSDLAAQLGLTRQRIGQAVIAGRSRWVRSPQLTGLREEILEIVRAQGGITTHDEVIAALLAAHGSGLDEPARSQMASVATRAALEAEKCRQGGRFDEYRRGDRIFLSLSSDLKQYALRP